MGNTECGLVEMQPREVEKSREACEDQGRCEESQASGPMEPRRRWWSSPPSPAAPCALLCQWEDSAPLVGTAQALTTEHSYPSTACHPDECGQRAFWREEVGGSVLKDQALTELNGFNSEDFVHNSESSFDGEMRGKELDTANTDNLSRCMARRVDKVRMMVTRKVFWV